MSNAVKSWSKWETGPNDQEAYGLFSEWLHSADYTTAIRPDVMDWAKETGKDRSKVLQLCVNWHWDARAKDYDAWRAMQPIVKIAPLFSHTAEIMHRIVKEELRRMEIAQKQAGDLLTMKHRDIIRMVEQLRKAEEFCIEALARKEEALAKGQATYDFTKLSIEDLRKLEDLHEQARIQ